MRSFYFFASSTALCVVLLPLVTPSCGGSTSTPPTQTGGGSAGSTGSGSGGAAGATVTSTDTCVVDADCTWGEIPNEILQATDCTCLYGCVYLPQTKATAMRRGDQHKALCNPTTDGKGQPCGIDDCLSPAAIACIDGACKAAPKDGGMLQ